MPDNPDRRGVMGLLAMSAFVPAAAAKPATKLPALVPIFSAKIIVGAPVELGSVDGGHRRFIPITGGTVTGPELQGEILPGGGDWQTIGSDGITEIHARYLIKTHDGAMIAIDNPGLRVASPDIIARLTAGEDLDPGLYYFRTTPSFEVSSKQYSWMRRSLFVATGVRRPDHVLLAVYRLE